MKKVNKLLLSSLCFALIPLLSIQDELNVKASDKYQEACNVLITNTVSGINSDYARYTDDGQIEIQLYSSPGYGTRANFSRLKEKALLDVKNFETEFTMNVDVGISTVFSLQTTENGTIGGGNGNGINILLRKDSDDKLTLAVYNQNASKTIFAGEKLLDIANDKKIKIKYSYDEDYIKVDSGNTSKTVDNVAKYFDSHYASYDYLGYYTLSSYYLAGVRNANSVYVVETINNITPKENNLAILQNCLNELESKVDLLDDNSTNEQIIKLNEDNLFTQEIYQRLVDKIADNEFKAKKEQIDAKIKHLNGNLEYNLLTTAITSFEAQLNNYQKSNFDLAKQYFSLIDSLKKDNLSETQSSQINQKISSLKDKTNYSSFILDYTDDYLKSFEKNVENEKVNSLDNYLKIENIESIWNEYKEKYHLNVLQNNQLDDFNNRIGLLKQSLNGSVYEGLWRQGDTWDVKQTELGLYATGLGAYGQAIGFNQKLEVGVDSAIKFNIIYAFRKLGANHLHIGFYPATNTATLGDYDGVRVDFWFAGTVIEVQPVNGKTETAVYDAAYLTIPDTGFFEMEDPDYELGSYDVKLLKDGNQLSISVNGYEMDITGLDASLYANGCYLTVSTMSYEGLDWNELLITSVGKKDYTKIEDDGGNEPQPEPQPEPKKGCKGQNNISFVSLIITMLTLSLSVAKRRVKYEN